MSAGAITMLIISIVVVWGGLLVSIMSLLRHPEAPEDED